MAEEATGIDGDRGTETPVPQQPGQVEGAIRFEQERVLLAEENGTVRIAHGTLWEADPDLTALLRAVFDLAGLAFDTVATAEEMLAAAASASPGDFLIIDCSQSLPDDVARCLRIVTETDVSVHVISPYEELVESLRPHALGELTALHPHVVGMPLLPRLRLLKYTAGSEAAQDIYAQFNPVERAVLRLVAEGRTDLEIAEDLDLGERTATRAVARVKAAAGLEERKESRTFYRRALRNTRESSE